MRDDWTPTEIILGMVAIIVALGTAIGIAIRLGAAPIAGAAGLAYATAHSGFASAAIAGWVPIVTAGCIATSTSILTVHLFVKVAKGAKKDSYDWILALLGFAGGTLVSFSRELNDNQSVRFVIGVLSSFWIVVAGACYKRSGWQWKAVAAGLYLFLPLCSITLALKPMDLNSVRERFFQLNLMQIIIVSSLFVIALLIALLERVSANDYARRP